MMFVRVRKGREGVSTLSVPLLAPPPGLPGNQALLCSGLVWSGDTKQTELSHTHSKLLLFPLKTLILPGERAALSDYREVMEQNIFKVVFPQLA